MRCKQHNGNKSSLKGLGSVYCTLSGLYHLAERGLKPPPPTPALLNTLLKDNLQREKERERVQTNDGVGKTHSSSAMNS